MTQTAHGVLLDAIGAATRQELVQGLRGPELRRNTWSHASASVRHVQPATIPVDIGHDSTSRVGQVIYLERDRHGQLHCVAHLDDTIQAAVAVKVGEQRVAVPHDLYWSGEFDSRMNGTDAEILSVAVTPQTARICATPIRLLPGDLNYRRKPRPEWKNLTSAERGLLERAAVYNAERRKHGGPLHIADVEQQRRLERANQHRATYIPLTRSSPLRGLPTPPQYRAGWKAGMIEWGQAGGRVISVH